MICVFLLFVYLFIYLFFVQFFCFCFVLFLINTVLRICHLFKFWETVGYCRLPRLPSEQFIVFPVPGTGSLLRTWYLSELDICTLIQAYFQAHKNFFLCLKFYIFVDASLTKQHTSVKKKKKKKKSQRRSIWINPRNEKIVLWFSPQI